MITLDAITFDLDDTLWDNQGVMLKTEEGHYRWLLDALTAWRSARQEAPLPLTYEAGVADYLQRRQQWASQVPERRGDFTWLRLRALEDQLEASGLPRSAALLWAAAAMNEFHRLRVQVTPHPEAAGLLSALAERYRLAAITNGNIHLKRQPLAAHFPVAIAAGELLAPKPEVTNKVYKKEGWNSYRVLVKGEHIQVWVNGTKISDGKDTRTHFAKGRLGFQVHGVGKKTEPLSVRWKNIKIREVE